MAKFTAAKIKEQIKKIQQATEKAKSRHRDQKNLKFIELTPEDIERKLKRTKSPLIFYGLVPQPAPPGATIHPELGIWNPDPIQAWGLHLHVWVGSGFVDPVVGTFLLNVDTRFPRLTQPPFPGLQIDPLLDVILKFDLKVPTGVERTTYLLSSCLMQAHN